MGGGAGNMLLSSYPSFLGATCWQLFETGCWDLTWQDASCVFYVIFLF